jgi:hypothetical protein
VNYSGDLVVVSSRSPNGPFLGPEGQDPFWSAGIFRMDLFGTGSGIEIIVSPAFLKTSNLNTVPFTTAYYFPRTKAPQAKHILTIPIKMVHYTDTMSIHTGITMASQAPIGTPLLPSVTPTLPPGYHVLNASIPTSTQTPSGTLGGPTSSGHSPPGFILTLTQPPFEGPFSSSISDTNRPELNKVYHSFYNLFLGRIKGMKIRGVSENTMNNITYRIKLLQELKNCRS